MEEREREGKGEGKKNYPLFILPHFLNNSQRAQQVFLTVSSDGREKGRREMTFTECLLYVYTGRMVVRSFRNQKAEAHIAG